MVHFRTALPLWTWTQHQHIYSNNVSIINLLLAEAAFGWTGSSELLWFWSDGPAHISSSVKMFMLNPGILLISFSSRDFSSSSTCRTAILRWMRRPGSGLHRLHHFSSRIGWRWTCSSACSPQTHQTPGSVSPWSSPAGAGSPPLEHSTTGLRLDPASCWAEPEPDASFTHDDLQDAADHGVERVFCSRGAGRRKQTLVLILRRGMMQTFRKPDPPWHSEQFFLHTNRFRSKAATQNTENSSVTDQKNWFTLKDSTEPTERSELIKQKTEGSIMTHKLILKIMILNVS